MKSPYVPFIILSLLIVATLVLSVVQQVQLNRMEANMIYLPAEVKAAMTPVAVVVEEASPSAEPEASPTPIAKKVKVEVKEEKTE